MAKRQPATLDLATASVSQLAGTLEAYRLDRIWNYRQLTDDINAAIPSADLSESTVYRFVTKPGRPKNVLTVYVMRRYLLQVYAAAAADTGGRR